MKIQKIVKSAIEDTFAEYTVFNKSKEIIKDFITTILAYNTATMFTSTGMTTLHREINASEDPAVIYSFLLDIKYKISLDLLELDIDSNILFSAVLNGHTQSLDDSNLMDDESFELYKPVEVGGLDIVIYLLIQNKFKLIEILKQL